MPSTFVHALLPSACLKATHKKLPQLTKTEWGKLLIVSMIIGNLPDLDVIPATIWKENWNEIHREWGHNIFSLILWTMIAARVLQKIIGTKFKGKIAWMVAGSLVASHVMLDAMATEDPTDQMIHGVPLFWPLTEAEFVMPVHIFTPYQIDETQNKLLAHATSLDYWRHGFLNELAVSVMLYLFWFITFQVMYLLEKAFKRRKQFLTSKAEAVPIRTSQP